MKIIINKNTPRDTIIYLRDILNGIKKKLNDTDDKETRKKIIATLLSLSTIIGSGAIIASKNAYDDTNESNTIEIDIPIDDLELEHTEMTNPTPYIAETTAYPTITESSEYIVPTESIEEQIVSRNNIGTPETVDEAIKIYTDIFEVKKGLVEPLVYEKIYRNPDFYSDYTLDGTSYPNLHEAIFFSVLDIVYNPGKYGYNNEELKSNIDWETDLTAEEMTFIFSEYFDVNPFFAQSIEYTECGSRMDSYDYLYNNNPAGIGPHNKFRNKATGIIYLLYILSENYNIGKDSGIEDLNRISSYYCTEGTDTWRKLTNEFYNELTTKGFLNRRLNVNEELVIDNITYDEYLSEKHVIRR
jgi:hypothetical protein